MLLNLPMCPVYGIGAVCLSELLSGFRDDVILLFSFGAILASAVELVFYLIFARLFYVKLWDYSEKTANFIGGVCGEYTLWWGLLAVIFVSYIDPVADKVIFAMTDYGRLVAVIFLSVVTASDIKATIQTLIEYKSGEKEKLPPCFWYMQKI